MLPQLNTLLKPRPRKYRNIVKHLSPLILQAPESVNLTAEDIFDDLSQSRGTDQFLGLYSRRGIELVLEKMGLFKKLQERQLPNATVQINTSDPFKHLFRIIHPLEDKRFLSCELVVRQGNFNGYPKVNLPNPTAPPSNMLVVEWLLLQNPRKTFTRKKPQLPGQDYPGLGLSHLAFELLYWTARRLKLDGVILVPNFLHTGMFYSRQLQFFNPQHQGILQAINKYLKTGVRLDQLSWGCAEGQLINLRKQEVFEWKPSPMVMPVTRNWKDYFHSQMYLRQVKNIERENQFQLNTGYEKKYNNDWIGI